MAKLPIREFNKYLLHNYGGGYLTCTLVGGANEENSYKIRRARTKKGVVQFWGGFTGRWLTPDMDLPWSFHDWTNKYNYKHVPVVSEAACPTCASNGWNQCEGEESISCFNSYRKRNPLDIRGGQ
jgi:hypothetical protein